DPRIRERWSPPPGLDAYRSGALVPIRSHDRFHGALVALDPELHGFAAEDVDFLVALAAEAASVLERSDLMAQLERLAGTDALTGLCNRREFERLLDEPVPGQLAVLAIDVDNLKPINDEFGHEAGDEVLRSVARTLSGLLRDWDLVARVGGDEFAALLMGATAEEALSVAERLGARWRRAPRRLAARRRGALPRQALRPRPRRRRRRRRHLARGRRVVGGAALAARPAPGARGV